MGTEAAAGAAAVEAVAEIALEAVVLRHRSLYSWVKVKLKLRCLSFPLGRLAHGFDLQTVDSGCPHQWTQAYEQRLDQPRAQQKVGSRRPRAGLRVLRLSEVVLDWTRPQGEEVDMLDLDQLHV